MYKTILVHVDASEQSAARIDAAARLAIVHEAHLVGSAMTGLSAFMFPVTVLNAGMPPVEMPVEELRADADRALDLFEARVAHLGVNSVERRRVDDEVGMSLCLQARYADLVVISQRQASEPIHFAQPDFTPYVVLNCARPVLVLPAAGAGGEIGKRVTVGWNGSPQAVRAIASAIGMLRRAEQVKLVVLANDDASDVHGEQPGADMALYLARLGVKVEVNTRHAGQDDGAALLSFAADQGSDLIVMGAFGHSRFREFVLGGVTRSALASSPLPLWMAH